MSMRRLLHVVLALAIASMTIPVSGCSTFLDFDHFASADGGSADAPPRDAPGTDTSRDAPASDTGVDAPTFRTLTVTTMGGGMVSSTPSGIACGTACTADFLDGATVMLTAMPDATSELVSWGGACSGSDPTCSVTLTAATAVQARFAPRGSVRWVHQITFPGADGFEPRVVVAPDGNPVVGTVVDDGGGSDLFVAKLDRATGSVIWMQHLDTPTSEDLGGIALDDAGNVYATVTIEGFGTTYVVAGTTFTGDLYGNVATYRLNGMTGAIEWGVQWGGGGQDRPQAIAVAGNDLWVAGGTSSSPASFGSGFTFSASVDDGFLVRASTQTGGVNRVQHFSGGGTVINGLAANSTHAVVVGSVFNTVTVDACSMHPSGSGYDTFIASFATADLSCGWSRVAGDSVSSNSNGIKSVAPMPDGGWVATGYFAGGILFASSGTSLASHGMTDAFAVRYGPNGEHVWSFRYGGTGNDSGEAITTMATGETFIAGSFSSPSILFGTFTLNGPSQVFVTRMTAGATPTHDWAVALGGDGPDRPEGIAVDPAGNPYVAAYFNGMTTVGGTALTGADYDTWVAALVR